jgi:cytochrome c-type biogenesis protein CcmH
MFIYSVLRRKGATTSTPAEEALVDLEAKRDALIAQLRELDDTASKLTPAQAAAERHHLEVEAAQVLRAIDQNVGRALSPSAASKKKGAKVVVEEQPVAVPAGNPAMKGFVWGAASVAAIAFLAWFVTNSAKPKEEAAPSSMSAAPQQQVRQQAATDPQLQALEARAKANPEDLDVQNELAKSYLDHENLMGAYQTTKAVLQNHPEDPRALTYNALVRITMGGEHAKPAEEMLVKAMKLDPQLLDPYVGLAFIYSQSGRAKEARDVVAEAERRHPEDKARLEDLLQQMQGRGQPQQQQQQPQTAAPATGGLKVTLSIDPRAKMPPGGVIYLIARPAGQTSGPPVAVKRVAIGAFPMTIDFTSADSMMGQPLPDKIHLEARLDTDGNAMTKDPTDLVASVDNLASSGAVSLALK